MGQCTENSLCSSDDLLFADDPSGGEVDDAAYDESDGGWKLLIVDDDEVIHSVSRLVLEDFQYKGKGLKILAGYSGGDARRLMEEHPDTAVLLLDVVMETDDAGLEAVRYIREQLNNHFVRIILRTGQPGLVPESQVITEYDINDYREKSELTSQKLNTSLITALRSYQDLKRIQQLSLSRDTLEHLVEERTSDLISANALLQSEIDKRTRANEALRKSEARLAEAQRIAAIGNWEWKPGTEAMAWSDQIFRILGLAQDGAPATFGAFIDAIESGDRQAVTDAIGEAVAGRRSYNTEYGIRRPDGTVRHACQQGEVCVDEDGSIRVTGTLQDITERHQAVEEMRKLSLAVEQTADAVIITDKNGVIEYVNPAFQGITGYSKADAVGRDTSLLKSGKQSQAFYRRLWKIINRGEVFSDVIINRRKNGTCYYEERTITPQKDGRGNITHYIATGKDITERMEVQQRLYHLAHHDALTGLPNRVLLQDRLGQSLARTRWHDRGVGVLFLDMDRFKIINDTLGHDAGDRLLRQIGERLTDCVREGDTVARLGGDEFAIILNDIAAQDDIPPLAQKVLDALAHPFLLNGQELFIAPSIGIAIHPLDGEDTQALLKKADVAMYHAKSLGGNAYQFYSDTAEPGAVERLTLETCLRRALDRDEFTLHYQPQFNLRARDVLAREALLRWTHPQFNSVSPMHFVPILEETGLIIPVGEWVLRTACTQERTRQDSGLPAQRVAVNLSIRQFKQRDLVLRIEEILRETGLAPRYLELEVTEGLLIDNVGEAVRMLHELHEMGVSLSIDDFGTGYSSMSYLKRLPFDTVKIDRSFVHDITTDPDDAAIAAAIITLAHTMDLEVVAEGVETAGQLKFLHEQGCDVIQGYLCSPPVELAAFDAVDADRVIKELDGFAVRTTADE